MDVAKARSHAATWVMRTLGEREGVVGVAGALHWPPHLCLQCATCSGLGLRHQLHMHVCLRWKHAVPQLRSHSRPLSLASSYTWPALTNYGAGAEQL